MGSDFFESTIGDQITLQRGFDITKKEQQHGDIPVVSSGGISSFHNEAKVTRPGVVLGRKGTLGTVFYLCSDYWPHDTTLWVKDFKGNLPRFVYYFFMNMADELKKMDVGAANPALNRNHVHPLRVVWPNRTTQQHIAHILGTLDDKIELNRQINTTLEAMAQTLFKSWFVDFDPVIDNALAAGHPIPDELAARAERRAQAAQQPSPKQPHTLPAHIRQQFPDRFVFTEEMGWVPEGWTPTPLDCIASYHNGLALQKFRPKDDDSDYLPVVKIAQLRKGYADGEEKASTGIKPECIIDNGDVVFSWSGSLVVDIWCGGKAALNQHLFKVTSEIYPKWFYHQFTCHHLEKFQRIAADKAVTMGHIKREHLRQALCVVPPLTLLADCTAAFGSLLDKSIETRLESRQLELLRDTLLPKLLSGQLRIPEAEQLLAEAL